jgi:hypothetical protein
MRSKALAVEACDGVVATVSRRIKHTATAFSKQFSILVFLRMLKTISNGRLGHKNPLRLFEFGFGEASRVSRSDRVPFS